jgi:signal transduction histidine kinase/response regulator RpfG family c-di-GMP phosphodiesterase
MNQTLITVAIKYERDVVLARQRAHQIAEVVGFDRGDQVRIATAVSEIARNAFRYAKDGKVEYIIEHGDPPRLAVRISDHGPGIERLKDVMDGSYVSNTGMGLGIIGARRLMDDFAIESSPSGTIVTLRKYLPQTVTLNDKKLRDVLSKLARRAPQDPFEEIQRQNQEVLSTLEEVQQHREALTQLNRELEDTNRGVLALYAELDERADYLHKASELKTQFLSNMTHEFRTPLNSIISLARILLDRIDGELTVEQAKQVTFIERAANDLSELVDDLLDLAKVEAGKVVIRPGEFHARDLFGALRGMLRPLLAHNSSVTLVFEDPPVEALLNTDESKVSQILRNLISNALKYTERGEVRVESKVLGSEAQFTVSDTGIGIADGDQGRIFEEFTQVEGEHQSGKRGTGLGLPLSRKLAELLGGSLTVESKLGKGSYFTLTIPMHYRGAGEVEAVRDVPVIDPGRLPVLVVEDNIETLLTYEKFLQGTNFQSVPARTIKKARQALERFRPVAIILDILLTHESTWAFLSEFKRNPDTKDIPVFVITMVENQTKAMNLGATAFSQKPVERQWLIDQLEKAIAKPEAQRALIIDDDPPSRYVLSTVLRRLAIQALEAENAVEGLRIASEMKPSIIFLDLKMPVMDGFETIEVLKQKPETRDIPVIVHTSKSITSGDRRKLEGKAVAILHKNHSKPAASERMIRHALKAASVETSPAL